MSISGQNIHEKNIKYITNQSDEKIVNKRKKKLEIHRFCFHTNHPPKSEISIEMT